MGVCLIPNGEGIPCAGQIEEGSPVGTVMLPGGPTVGHKKCSDGHYARKMQQEREQRENMVKLAKQGGPGGVVDLSNAEDAIENPSPLVKKEIAVDPTGVAIQHALSQPASEPHQLTDDEQAAMKEFKQKLLDARAGMVTEEVGKAIAQAEHALAILRQAAIKLADAYDKVVAERDEARSQRDTSKATSS
jgi:hypothetical protein